jgi:signal transduction histidine kinase
VHAVANGRSCDGSPVALNRAAWRHLRVPSLKTLVRRSATPVQLAVQLDRRLPDQIEIAAYYLVSEALTNTAKHAQATMARVEADIAGASVLRVHVRDDGCGGADLAGGSGLVGLRDRVEALGGRLSVHSPPGSGTTLHAELPFGDAGAISG